MAEKQRFITKFLSYEGLFDYKEFFRVMDVWYRDKFYDKHERRNEQITNPDGSKQIELEFLPWKKVTDYYRLSMKIEMSVTKMKDVEVDIDGKKRVLQHGLINMKFTGYLSVDYERKWNTAFQYFLRDIFDKYINRAITQKYEIMLVGHVNDLYNTMQAYLNMQQYRKGL